MFHPQPRRVLVCLSAILLTFSLTTPLAWGQHGSEGKVNVTVLDPQGAVVSGAALTLVDIATNDSRTAATSDHGTYTFVNLDIGSYKLTVTKAGFAAQTLDNVIVQATKLTDISVKLAIGAQVQQVQVEAVAPIVETSTNQISTVIDPKQIETLPITGRDVTQLSRLTPGFAGSPYATSSGNNNVGVQNGLPTSSQGNNIDGIVGSPSRMKFSGNIQSSVAPRLENIEEMAIQTDQIDLNSGFGQAATQVNFVTRRGTNAWHGRLFEDFRNDWLNANSWFNNNRGNKRPALKRNEFGGSVGGPILKDKLFFFFSLSTLRQPGSTTRTSNLLTPAAQAGNFKYGNNTVNVFQLAQAFNGANQGTTNGVIAGQLSAINASLSGGTVTPAQDLNVNTVSFLVNNPSSAWYPTIRVDYNTSRSVRMNLAINRTLTLNPGANTPYFPGSSFAATGDGTKTDGATVAYGLDWTITPKLINQFKAGWLYNTQFFDYNSPKAFLKNPVDVNWNPTNFNFGLQSPQTYYRPVSTYYPVFNISDTMNWQKGAHSFAFGFSWIREQDHYWNPPEGINFLTLGLVNGDLAYGAFSASSMPGSNSTQQDAARSLYALLTGRVSSSLVRNTIDTKTGKYQTNVTAYNLDELSKAWGLFAQDSWRFRPSLTVNFGLRWDFTGPDYDLGGAYHSSDLSSIYGPTAPQNLFKPGQLGGNNNPTIEARPRAYQSWNVSPQPAVGIAWSLNKEGGILGTILGKDVTVIRAAYSLRRFTVPYQYVWDSASDYGSFFYQFGTTTASNTPGAGNFAPGSYLLGGTAPTQALSPTSYVPSLPASSFTFINGSPGINGFKFNLSQPYTQTWTLGIQRSLGSSRVLEVRYNGNRTLKQWIALNTNEVNVFENGFLKEFQAAQSNSAVCAANSAACLAAQTAAGVPSGSRSSSNFANWGLAGQVNLPIITAAFTGNTTGSQASTQFSNGTFLTDLTTGQVGDMARRLGSNSAVPYFCNLVGPAFTPCVTNAKYTGTGAGFPINFFVGNPYAITGTTATGTGLMTDAGSSSYNALQVDFRQRPWHGVQFDANYTWSKTLTMLPGNSGNDWTGAFTGFSLRNMHDSYVPAAYDLHHIVHVNASADLPFGRGRRYMNSGGAIDRVFGGWNLGTIMTIQSGYPFRVTGGYLTYNNIADSGVVLNGVTRDQLQSAIGVHRIPGSTLVTLIDPKYLTLNATGTSNSGANPALVTANITPGTYATPVWLYGPHGFFQDMMITKNFAFTERFRFNLQGEFLNVWNHPVFGQGTSPIGVNIRTSSWGTTTSSSVPARNVELRANFIF